MGLLDALFDNGGSGGGLLGALPSWQWKNPADDDAKKDFLAALMQDPSSGNNLVPTQSPFGPVPQMAQPQAAPQSVFNSGAAPFAPAPGYDAMMPPPAPQSVFTSGAPPFTGAPMFAQSPAPPPQATPPQAAPAPRIAQPSGPINTMDIGGYQMPQFGTVADYTPAPAPAPVAAPDARAPAALPAFLQSPGSGGGFGGAARGAMANLQNGPLGMIAGAVGGAMGMGQGSDRDVQRQNQKAQYEALIANGLSPQRAMLAILNPEASKTLIDEALSNKEEFKTIKDGFGGEHPAFVSTRDQTINGKTVDEYNRSGGMSQGGQQTYDAIAQARDAGATPEQLYQMVPASLRGGVQAMIEGRALPTNLSARGGARDNALLLAHSIDPTFDETKIAARVQALKDWTGGGKSSETVRKTDQSALHFGELIDKMQMLPGHTLPAVNAVSNFANTQLLGKGEEGNFIINGHALADELSTMFKGVGISDAEIRAWESRLSPNMSAEQQRGMAKTIGGLYRDSLEALDKKRTEALGPVIAGRMPPIINATQEAALAKAERFASGGAAPAPAAGGIQEGATATNPTTGQKITFRGGRWQ